MYEIITATVTVAAEATILLTRIIIFSELLLYTNGIQFEPLMIGVTATIVPLSVLVNVTSV